MNNLIKLNKIKAVLAETGVTSWMLAVFMNVTEQTVSNWCKNIHQPSKEDFRKIADFLVVDQRELIVSTKPAKNDLAEKLIREHKKFLSEGNETYIIEKNKKAKNKVLNPVLVTRLRLLVEKHKPKLSEGSSSSD